MTAKQFYERTYAQADEALLRWRERGGSVKAANIRAIAGDLPIESVLDIGSGTGAVLAGLSAQGMQARFWAIDIAQEAAALIQRRDDIPGLVEARGFDGVHIPYADQQFDLAVLSHVVEHLDDPQPLLSEAARVARYVAIEVPLEANLHVFLKVRVFGSKYREQIGHIQWFSQSSFRACIERAGKLDIVRMRVVYVPDDLYMMRKHGLSRVITPALLGVRKVLRSVSNRLYTRLMTDHCIVLARSRRA
ncbi:MAG TPA: class I SAM-dependent methyltransferase [Roseiflexaceae bacterium]|nr:class I SAM-dependent methyltransferase [Roseiflexaceae bacterium]